MPRGRLLLSWKHFAETRKGEGTLSDRLAPVIVFLPSCS
jgi:hypothetical protein